MRLRYRSRRIVRSLFLPEGTTIISRLAVLLVAGLFTLDFVAARAQAASPSDTVVNVGEMCGGCVKKITARLNQMPEIASFQCDIAKKTVTVTPAAAGLSPRVLWEALEEIGKKPVTMVGPAGTFTTKPAN